MAESAPEAKKCPCDTCLPKFPIGQISANDAKHPAAFLGCDVSTTSPAFVMICPSKNFIGALAFFEREPCQDLLTNHSVFMQRRLPTDVGASRYIAFASALNAFIHYCVSTCGEICIYPSIEDYAYGFAQRRTNSLTALAEVSGVIKAALVSMGLDTPFPRSIGTIKKVFSGDGTASKFLMHCAFTLVPAYERFMTGWPALASVRPADNPLQDVVDAYAVASTHMTLHRYRIARPLPDGWEAWAPDWPMVPLEKKTEVRRAQLSRLTPAALQKETAAKKKARSAPRRKRKATEDSK